MKMREIELMRRISLCRFFIKVIEGCNGDPRQADALAHYQKQLKHMENCLQAVREGRPEPIVIGLKPGRLTAKPTELNKE